MKNNHITTAIKALKRQLVKYQIDRDKYALEEQDAKHSKEFFATEIEKLEEQIQQLEGTEVQKELALP